MSAFTNVLMSYGPSSGPPILVMLDGGATADTQRIATSSDGINWTLQTSPDNYSMRDVAYSPKLGRMVIVGSALLYTSDDAGVSWTEQTPISGSNWSSITWSPTLEIFVAVNSASSTDGIAYSSDGINWTFSPNTYDHKTYEAVIWDSTLGLFIAGSAGALSPYDMIITSPDALTWTTRDTHTNTSGYGYQFVYSLASSPSVIIPANQGDPWMYSTNGIDWQSRTGVPASGTLWVAYGTPNKSDRWVWGYGASPYVYSTADPTASSLVIDYGTGDAAAGGESWKCGAWSDGIGLFSTANSSNQVAYSADGIAWTFGTAPTKAINGNWKVMRAFAL